MWIADVVGQPVISKVSCIMYWANARKRIPTRRVNDFLACGRQESERGMGEAMAIVFYGGTLELGSW